LCADVERKGRRQREGKERKAKIIERGEMWWSLSYASQALKKKKKNNINAPRESTLHRVYIDSETLFSFRYFFC